MFRHDVNECDLGHHCSENSESKQQRGLLQGHLWPQFSEGGAVMATFRGADPHFAGICSVVLQLAFYI